MCEPPKPAFMTKDPTERNPVPGTKLMSVSDKFTNSRVNKKPMFAHYRYNMNGTPDPKNSFNFKWYGFEFERKAGDALF